MIRDFSWPVQFLSGTLLWYNSPIDCRRGVRMIDLEALKKAVGRLDEDRTNALVDSFIARKPGSAETWRVMEAFNQGVEIVGGLFEIGKYCAGELIFAGELLSACIDKLRPLLGEGQGAFRGILVVGSVEGDIHDIGKNIVKSLAEISGFRVEDIGVDQKPSAFVDAARRYRPQIMGLSGLLTSAIESMKRTVDALREAGLREGLKIAIGGGIAGEIACRYTGADIWSKNAAEAVKIFETWFPPAREKGRSPGCNA
jgi:methanogenic corrinoid protein MtbC1